MELLPFLASFWVVMDFSLVAAWSMLAGFERLNREIQVLLHSMNLIRFERRKKGRSCGWRHPTWWVTTNTPRPH